MPASDITTSPTQASFPIPRDLAVEVDAARMKEGPEVPKRATFFRKLIRIGLAHVKAEQARAEKVT